MNKNGHEEIQMLDQSGLPKRKRMRRTWKNSHFSSKNPPLREKSICFIYFLYGPCDIRIPRSVRFIIQTKVLLQTAQNL